MTQARGVKLFAMQRTEMWSRWKLGQSLHEIGRAFGKDHGVVDFMLSQHGGNCSCRTSSLAPNAHVGGAREYLPRDCFGFVDS